MGAAVVVGAPVIAVVIGMGASFEPWHLASSERHNKLVIRLGINSFTPNSITKRAVNSLLLVSMYFR